MVMVTDGGKLIRIPLADISIVGRSTRGVTLFKTAEDERVVSVSRLRDVDDDEDDVDDEEGEGGETAEGETIEGEATEGVDQSAEAAPTED